jgi:serine phosphatase RsbU (regulator of sigma subunit)
MSFPEPTSLPATQNAGDLLLHVDQLQRTITSLQQEVDLLHRRDESLNGYMQKLDEEMRLAARLQYDFLPKKIPQLGNVQIHTLFRPAGYVSGDLYDVMRLDETHIGFYVADAVGHGMPAALLTMFMKNALITKETSRGSYQLVPPAQTIAHLNRSLCDQQLSHATFATALYGVLDTKSLAFNFSRGGHPNPLLLRKTGELLELTAEGSLLGIFDDETFDTGSAKLQSGDRLFIYTDGIEVAFAEDRGVIDTQAWKRELQQRHKMTTAELLADFNRHLDSETGSLMPKDDLTLILVEIG